MRHVEVRSGRAPTSAGALLLTAVCCAATAPLAAQDGAVDPVAAAEAAAERAQVQRREQYEKLFAHLDKNRNNVLAVDELPEQGASKWLDRFDSDGDDEIRKAEYLGIVDRGPGFDRLFIIRDVRARANDALRQFDRDKDGLVTAEEYPGNKNVFKKADRNKSDILEWNELVRLADDELDDIRKKMKSPTRYEFLNLFDLNGDRKVEANEYDGPARAFRKFDENGDGTVDYYEIYPERMMDMDARRPEPQSMNVVTALDANNDGRVSREEFKGTPAAWQRLDRNRDGWITSADAR